MALAALKGWTTEQKHVVAASYLGWTLDAFDYFLLVLVLTDVAREFGVSVAAVSWATFFTLAMRPVGAFLFGRLADHFGRRPIMMINVLCYAGLAFVSAFSPNLVVFFILRGLFGVAMGGEWGVGASLTMESVPPASRGFVSGVLQAGYPTGYLLASAAYGLLFPMLGWRGAVHVRHRPGISRALHPPLGTGIARLEQGARQARRSCQCAEAALAAGALCHPAHDGVQLLQPWHAGSLPDLPQSRSSLQAAHGFADSDFLQCRRDPRRTARSARFRSAWAAATR